MTTREAIFYAEHPLAILRDCPCQREQEEVLRGVERALRRAPVEDPLAIEAYHRRQESRRRSAVGAGEAARRILAWKRAGFPPPRLPETPSRPDGRRRSLRVDEPD